MNKQQRLLLLLFIGVVVILVAAIIGVNLSRRNAAADALALQPSPGPTVELPELHGKTEEEIAAMALQEEGDDYVTAFDDPDVVEPLDPNATAEPID